MSIALCAELAGARNYGGLVHAAVASEGNPLSSSIGSNSRHCLTWPHSQMCGPLYEALNSEEVICWMVLLLCIRKPFMSGESMHVRAGTHPKPFFKVQFRLSWDLEEAWLNGKRVLEDVIWSRLIVFHFLWCGVYDLSCCSSKGTMNQVHFNYCSYSFFRYPLLCA